LSNDFVLKPVRSILFMPADVPKIAGEQVMQASSAASFLWHARSGIDWAAPMTSI
jgi:hypothetical protein